jgi:hypothetical protein
MCLLIDIYLYLFIFIFIIVIVIVMDLFPSSYLVYISDSGYQYKDLTARIHP